MKITCSRCVLVLTRSREKIAWRGKIMLRKGEVPASGDQGRPVGLRFSSGALALDSAS